MVQVRPQAPGRAGESATAHTQHHSHLVSDLPFLPAWFRGGCSFRVIRRKSFPNLHPRRPRCDCGNLRLVNSRILSAPNPAFALGGGWLIHVNLAVDRCPSFLGHPSIHRSTSNDLRKAPAAQVNGTCAILSLHWCNLRVTILVSVLQDYCSAWGSHLAGTASCIARLVQA